jgi:hypothetical protein
VPASRAYGTEKVDVRPRVLGAVSRNFDPDTLGFTCSWAGACPALLIVFAVYSLAAMFIPKDVTGSYAFYRGVSRILWFIVLSDEEYLNHTGGSSTKTKLFG